MHVGRDVVPADGGGRVWRERGARRGVRGRVSALNVGAAVSVAVALSILTAWLPPEVIEKLLVFPSP